MIHVMHHEAITKMKQMRAYLGRERRIYWEDQCLRCTECGQSIAPIGAEGLLISELLTTFVAHNMQCHELDLKWEGYEHDYA